MHRIFFYWTPRPIRIQTYSNSFPLDLGILSKSAKAYKNITSPPPLQTERTRGRWRHAPFAPLSHYGLQFLLTFLFVLHLARTWFFRHKKFLASVRACNTIRNTGKGQRFEIPASSWVTGCVAGKTPDPSASPEQTQKSEK